MENLQPLEKENFGVLISLERKQLEGLKLQKQNIEENINYLTELQSFIITLSKLLKKKCYDCVKYSTFVTFLFTFLITSIVACMGYTTEIGFKINEIITAFSTSFTLSSMTMAGVSIWSYQRDKKDLNSYNAIQISKELEEANVELTDVIKKIANKEKELRNIESKNSISEKNSIDISTQHLEFETKKETDYSKDEDTPKVKRFKLNNK